MTKRKDKNTSSSNEGIKALDQDIKWRTVEGKNLRGSQYKLNIRPQSNQPQEAMNRNTPTPPKESEKNLNEIAKSRQKVPTPKEPKEYKKSLNKIANSRGKAPQPKESAENKAARKKALERIKIKKTPSKIPELKRDDKSLRRNAFKNLMNKPNTQTR